MNPSAVRGIALEIGKPPHLRPFSALEDISWAHAGFLIFLHKTSTRVRDSGKTHELLKACRVFKAYVVKRGDSPAPSIPILADPDHYDSTLRQMLRNEPPFRPSPRVAFYCPKSPDRWSAAERSELSGELDSAIEFLSELAMPTSPPQDPPNAVDSDRSLQLARERRDQLLTQEKWIDAPAVHLQQGGKADSQGINNTASRLRRRGELLGAWNGREYMHPTFQFHPDTGLLMSEMKTLLSVLPKDRSGWRQALWLFQRHAQLEGARPADVFSKNPDRVIQAARSDFEVSDERW